MAKKAKRQFSPADKARAVDDYVSGRRTGAQIGAELNCAPNLIYRWKAETDAARRDDRAAEIEASGVRDPRDVKRILDLEDELDAYKKTVAEQTVLIDLLKKARSVEELSTRERIDRVDQNFEKLGSKKKALKAMRLLSSTYYSDPKVSRSEREAFEADVRGKIEQIRVDMPGAGYRMLLPVLKSTGIEIGERRLRGILSKFELQIRPKKKFVRTTDSNHSHRVYPNLLEEMTVTGVNQVWASDITYIRIESGSCTWR